MTHLRPGGSGGHQSQSVVCGAGYGQVRAALSQTHQAPDNSSLVQNFTLKRIFMNEGKFVNCMAYLQRDWWQHWPRPILPL